MNLAHPIGTGLAVPAVPTRHDLFADCMVADFEAVQCGGAIPEPDHFTNEFVPRGYGGLAVAHSMIVTPKKSGTRVTLYIAGSYPRAFHLEQHLTEPRFRNRTFFESIIVRAMRHHGRHGLW